jgi:hypothetical protein
MGNDHGVTVAPASVMVSQHQSRGEAEAVTVVNDGVEQPVK